MNFYGKYDLLKERIDILCSNSNEDNATKSGLRKLKPIKPNYKPKEDRKYKSPAHILSPHKHERDTRGLDINTNWA